MSDGPQCRNCSITNKECRGIPSDRAGEISRTQVWGYELNFRNENGHWWWYRVRRRSVLHELATVADRCARIGRAAIHFRFEPESRTGAGLVTVQSVTGVRALDKVQGEVGLAPPRHPGSAPPFFLPTATSSTHHPLLCPSSHPSFPHLAIPNR